MGFNLGDIVNPATIGGVAGAFLGGPAGAAVGAQLGGGLMSQQATAKANQANIKQSREQMAFQERMSSTAHQRQVEDLKKAGLNPILSANTGASAPTGSMAQIQAEDPQLGNLMASAMEMKVANQGLRNQKAQEQATKAQARKTNTETTLLKAKEPQAEIKHDVMRFIQKKAEQYLPTAKKHYRKAKKSFQRSWKSKHKIKQNIRPH